MTTSTTMNEGTAGHWRAAGKLPDGPLDVVGDIHGELGALRALMHHMGYAQDGSHPEGRRMVFLGDLIDRGPDSPGVVELVRGMMEKGRATAVMGNHDLNAVARRTKSENTWLFGHGPAHETERKPESDAHRDEMLGFLATLPIALERDDLRVVHACWAPGAIAEVLAGAVGAADSYHSTRKRLKEALSAETDEVTRSLRHQNENPIRVVTAGPEGRASKPYFAAGKMRGESRLPWWRDYQEGPLVVFGHYWRIPISVERDDGLFAKVALNELLEGGRSMCIDYSVGNRAAERRAGAGAFRGRLAALRWPERTLVFDDGQCMPVVDHAGSR